MSTLVDRLDEYGADLTGAMSRFLGDEEFYISCFEDFLKDEVFAQLDAALAAEEYGAAFDAAHSIKGVSGNLGLTPLYEAACDLAEPLRARGYADVRALHVEVMNQYRILKALSSGGEDAAVPDLRSMVRGSISDEVVHKASVPMLALDAQGCILLANRMACDILGYAEEACIGRHYGDLLVLTQRPSFMENAIKCGEVGDLFNREGRFFEISRIAEYPMDDGCLITLSTISDVTVTYQNQELLEYLKNDAPIGVFKILMDKYFTTVYATDTFYAIHGFTREEYNIERVGRSVNYMPPDDVKVAERALFEAYEAGEKSMQFEMLIVRRDGSRGWLLTQCSFVDTVDGPIMYGFVTDNTIVKRQQEEIQELERICTFTLNEDYEDIYLFDLEKNEYRGVSKKGITRKELLPRGMMEQWYADCFLALPAEERDGLISRFLLATVKETLDERALYEFLFPRCGTEGKVRRALASYRYYDDERMKVILCIRDVEDEERQKEALAQLRAAKLTSQAKSDFLSRMSHDIRTPMNSIRGSVEIVKTVPGIPEGVEESLHHIEIASDFLLSLINDVLDMNQIESGKMRIISEPFDLNDLVRSATLLASGSVGKAVAFHCEVSSNLARVYVGDELRLKQVLMNLLSNAMKYCKDPGGEVWMRVEPLIEKGEACGLRFEIKDNGAGMSEDFVKNRLGRPFEREHDDKHSSGSSGLGLVIVEHITELMQGSFSVESTLGRGTVFVVEVPMLASDRQLERQAPISFEGFHALVIDDDTIEGGAEIDAVVPSAYLMHRRSIGLPSGSEVCFDGQRVLLAEDHDLNAQISKKLLELHNLQVERACDGREAWQLFAKSDPGYYAVVLMDIRMPVMDGLEATRAIRACAHPQAGSIPVIALSANSLAEDIEKAREAGMQDHLGKPLDVDTLISLLCKYLMEGDPR